MGTTHTSGHSACLRSLSTLLLSAGLYPWEADSEPEGPGDGGKGIGMAGPWPGPGGRERREALVNPTVLASRVSVGSGLRDLPMNFRQLWDDS